MDLPSRRCDTCILPETPPLISLDSAGTCDYCRAYQKRYGAVDAEVQAAREAEFARRLQAAGKKTRSYDCLVPISGGKDSMYALHTCARTYGMNVLAFNFDNGFQSVTAALNIKTAVERLGVDFVQVKPSQRTLFDLYRLFLSRTGDFCAPCNRIIAESGIRLARQYGIPLIVTGNSRRWQAAIHGMSISKYGNIPYFWNVVDGHMKTGALQTLVRRRYTRDALLRMAGLGPRTIDLFEHVNPMKEGLLETLQEELGWEPPSEGLEHGDCLVSTIKDYLACRKWGFSEVTGGYANRVRNGKLSRQEALERAEAEEPREEPAVLEMFLDRIGVTRPEFEEAIGRAHFTDFSNEQSATFRTLKRIARLLR
ncbi:MAG: hypothetical protein JW990_13660 [Thermoleophilia bacterium]|nr:hypothetical protein [Thermoleophilia bacterium]